MSAFLSSGRPPLSLRILFPRASFVGCADVAVSAVTADSRRCRPGETFAALPGTNGHGADFAIDAVHRGAVSILAERPLAHVNVPQCIVPAVRRAYARLCAALQGEPSRSLGTVGVTGTNGKTTVTWLVRSILASAGHRCGLLGTIEYSDGFDSEPSPLTTPGPDVLNGQLAGMVSLGTRFAAMEVSSHALHQDRIAGAGLDAAVVTNITQDHFDYHGDVEAYRRCKARILEHCKPGGRAVLNRDDESVRSFANQLPENVSLTTFGFGREADVSAEVLDESLDGTVFLLHRGTETIEVRTPLAGRHNVSNCLAAAAAVSHFGLSLDEIAHGIAALECVPGRLERIEEGQPFAAFVDYAHTDDALRRCVRTLKQLTAGRVICVFGAGGDRDRTKRPLLGEAAAEADVAILTSDNPRSEDPQRIIEDILRGMPRDGETSFGECSPHVEIDREAAIRRAVEWAEEDDCILVAGKGHETVQIIRAERKPFDDRTVVRAAVAARCAPAIAAVGN